MCLSVKHVIYGLYPLGSCFVFTAMATSTVKLESFERSDYTRNVGICERLYCKRLLKNITDIATTTDPTEKQAQRDRILCQLNTVLEALPATGVVNVLLFDDWLGPNSAGDPATGRLFTEDILDRYRGSRRIRLFLPNIKAAVIERLKQPGRGTDQNQMHNICLQNLPIPGSNWMPRWDFSSPDAVACTVSMPYGGPTSGRAVGWISSSETYSAPWRTAWGSCWRTLRTNHCYGASPSRTWCAPCRTVPTGPMG
jgi:hypothetical protein